MSQSPNSLSIPKSPQQQQSPPTPAQGVAGRLWSGTKWAASTAAWGLSRPIAAPVNYVLGSNAQTVGSGLASGAKGEIEQMLQPEGPLGIKLKQTLEQALLHQPPQQMFVLKDLLNKAVSAPQTLTGADLLSIRNLMRLLSHQDNELLKKLAPDMDGESMQFCIESLTLFVHIQDNIATQEGAQGLQEAIQGIQQETIQERLANFNQIFSEIMHRNQGALIQALSHLQQALLSEEGGVLSEALEMLKRKCIHEENGLIRQVVTQLNDLLIGQGGTLDILSRRLSQGEESILGQAVQILQTRLLGENGIADQLGNKLNDRETGIITQALGIAREKFDAMLQEGLDLLRIRVSGDGGILQDAIKTLNESLFNEGGTVARLRAEITDENRGILTETLKKLAVALNDEHAGIVSQGIDLLKRKLNNDHDGVLTEALRLLDRELNGPGGAVEKLQQRFLNTRDGMLTQALNQLQDRLNDEQTGILSQSLKLLKDRLLAENGVVDNLGKSLTDEETGILSKAVLNLKVALEKRDGPLDLLDQKLQHALSEALNLLQTRCLDERDGLLTQVLARLQEKLNDERTGLLTQSLTLLEKRLVADGGLLDTLRHKLTHEETGILSQAVQSLNLALRKSGGPLDLLDQRLQATLTQALSILSDKCLNAEDGIMTKALHQLQEKLNHEQTGILAHSVALLEKRLLAEGGLIDTVGKRLTEGESSILTKALALFQDKLNNEDHGILATSIQLLEKRVLGEHGLLDSLSKQLFAGDRSLIAQASASLKASLEKSDGPLALLELRLQKTLNDALDTLSKKCLDEKDGLVARALKQMTAQLHEEHGLLDTLTRRLNDPTSGIIAGALNALNHKLTEKGGTLDLLEQRVLGETGLLPKAIALLSTKLQENLAAADQHLLGENGTVNRAATLMQKKLVDKDGLLDQALHMLEDRLNHAERGLLVKAKTFLSDTLTHEKEGIIAKAIDLLNTKLRAQDGPIAYLETRLTEMEKEILSKAADVLQQQVNEIDHRLTGQAHPLLIKARTELKKLRDAIHANNSSKIGIHSKTLRETLALLATQSAHVFTTRMPLASTDLQTLQQLQERLPTFYGDTPPAQGEMLLTVEGGLSVLERYYGSQAGVAARTGEILRDAITDATDSLDPLLKRVENLGGTMVNNLLGRNPAAEQTPAAGGQPAGQQEGTLSQFLDQGGSVLKSILGKGKEAVSQQALSSFASVLKLVLKQVMDNMDDSEASRKVKDTLSPLAATLGNMGAQGGNWDQLYTHIRDTSKALSGVKIYVNGFRIPEIGPSAARPKNAEIVLAENANALKAVKDAPRVQTESPEWKEKAKKEQVNLVKNTTQYLTISYIYENVCKLHPATDKFYLEMMTRAKRAGPDSSKELKKLFFEELKSSKVGRFTRLRAQAYYLLCEHMIRRLTEKATTTYFEEIFKQIERLKADKFETLRNQLLTDTTRYLAILGGAYKKVAENPHTTGTLKEMLMAEMEKKESNLGFATNDLYVQMVYDVLKKTQSPAISWLAKRFIGNPETIVRSIVDKTAGSMQDSRGYTHALNCVIREQLDEVWELLQADLRGDNQGQNDVQILKDLSRGKKDQLAGLLKNLFEVLRKSKCGTIDELRELLKGQLLSAKVNSAVDDLFMEDILERAITLLAVTIQSLVKEEQLQKLTYRFASLVNRSFEIGDEVSPGEMQKEERNIALRSEQILRLAIGNSVQEKFDFSGVGQQDQTNAFIKELHDESMTWFQTSEQVLTELGRDGMDITSLESRNKIETLLDNALAFQSGCSASSFRAKSSKVNSDNKDEIGKRYLEMAERSKPFVQTIVQLKNHSATLENLGIAIPHLQQILRLLPAIGLKIAKDTVTLEDIDAAEAWFKLLETHMEDLKKMPIHPQQFALMAAQNQTIAQILAHFRLATRMRDLGIELARHNSLIDQIAQKQEQCLNSHTENPSLEEQCAELREQLVRSVDPARLPQLLDTLNTLKNTKIPQQIAPLRQQFLRQLGEAVDQANQTIIQKKEQYRTISEAIPAIIAQTQLLDPSCATAARNGLQTSIAQAKQHLESLVQRDAQGNPQFRWIQQIPFINIRPVDMKGIQDWAGEIVYNRVKERQEGLFNFVRQPETYRYGLNHLFLIPYVKSLKSGIKQEKL